MVTSRMSWNAESSASCRFPMDRVTSHTKKKMTVARTMISMAYGASQVVKCVDTAGLPLSMTVTAP